MSSRLLGTTNVQPVTARLAGHLAIGKQQQLTISASVLRRSPKEGASISMVSRSIQQSAPVVGQRELAQHLLGVLGGRLHGRHARCLLAAVVLQQPVVQRLQHDCLGLSIKGSRAQQPRSAASCRLPNAHQRSLPSAAVCSRSQETLPACICHIPT